MTIQRYEIDIERDEDEQGNPESILAPYRHDKGDWCKAEDVDALEAENAEQAAEIERLSASKWISVDERLPDIPRGHESSGVVLVIADDECQSLCTFYEDGSFCDEYQEEFTNVTHWQPLPDQPDTNND
jgi:hypothetical protein